MIVRSLGAAMIASALLLAGCGTTDAPKTDTSNASTSETKPVTITDSRGKTITLKAPASKVVTLEWSVTEYAIALGVNPIGVADPKGYTLWDTVAPIKGDTTDVGLRTEPSIDTIAGLEPDLILADVSSIPADAMAQMERIAPVAVFKSATADGLIDLLKKNQHDVATLLGKKDAAAALDKEFDSAIAAAKKKIADAGRAGDPIVMASPSIKANAATFRIHGPGSAPSVIASLIGLTDAATEKGDGDYGLATSDLEGLRKLPDATHFLYWEEAEGDKPIEELKKNALWNALPYVAQGRVVGIANGTWIYGGTPSLAVLAGEVANAVTAS